MLKKFKIVKIYTVKSVLLNKVRELYILICCNQNHKTNNKQVSIIFAHSSVTPTLQISLLYIDEII